MQECINWIREYMYTQEQAENIIKEAREYASATGKSVLEVICYHINIDRRTFFPIQPPLNLLNFE